jgi:hypothetical protein
MSQFTKVSLLLTDGRLAAQVEITKYSQPPLSVMPCCSGRGKRNTVSPRRISSHAAQVEAGLPDGLFEDQKSKFGYILEGLGMKNVGIFYIRLFGIIMAI